MLFASRQMLRRRGSPSRNQSAPGRVDICAKASEFIAKIARQRIANILAANSCAIRELPRAKKRDCICQEIEEATGGNLGSFAGLPYDRQPSTASNQVLHVPVRDPKLVNFGSQAVFDGPNSVSSFLLLKSPMQDSNESPLWSEIILAILLCSDLIVSSFSQDIFLPRRSLLFPLKPYTMKHEMSSIGSLVYFSQLGK